MEWSLDCRVETTDVYAQGTQYGKNEYIKACATCHGVTGKGDGHMAKALSKPPPDLTKLSESNKGVFPAPRIYDVIDGRMEVMNHGSRDMPVWGDVFAGDLTARLPRDSLSKGNGRCHGTRANPDACRVYLDVAREVGYPEDGSSSNRAIQASCANGASCNIWR